MESIKTAIQIEIDKRHLQFLKRHTIMFVQGLHYKYKLC